MLSFQDLQRSSKYSFRKGRCIVPKISVIIPVYNVEKFLKRCLDSVLAQTFQDFEVICVNDGSTDRSGEVLTAVAEKNPNIKVYTQANQGLSIARNNGLKYSSGDYVCFCDSDEDALAIEEFLVTDYIVSRNDSYNLIPGGTGRTSFKHSEDAKKRISEAHLGRKFTDTHRNNLSESKKGK